MLRRSPPSLVHVVEHDIDQEIREVVNTASLDSQATQLLGQTIPSIHLSKVQIRDLESADVLESKKWYSSIKWKLLVAGDQL